VIAKLIALVVPLGLDTFAVAAALGMLGVSGRRGLRITVMFTGFEAAMPLIGLALGAPLGAAIGDVADYLAIAVLVAFGVYTLIASDRDESSQIEQLSEARGRGALLLGVSISLDELAIGFTLGLLRLPAGLVIALIALQTVIVTQLGLRFGGRLSESLREGAERLAGVALTVLGIVLLAQHLFD
jgi:putative Mn2+ efflux pump MntP